MQESWFMSMELQFTIALFPTHLSFACSMCTVYVVNDGKIGEREGGGAGNRASTGLVLPMR